MKILKNKKFTRRFTLVLASTLLFTTVLQAAALTKKINVTFKNIKVLSNGQAKTLAQEPFIYNNSVYLPLRAVAELVGKEVDWNGATNAVNITDKGAGSNATMQGLQAQIAAKDLQIAKLMGEKSMLESEIKKLGGGPGTGSPAKLQKTLSYIQDEFDYEYSIDWDFKLSESNGRINVEVSFDSRSDGRRWDDLSNSKRESFFRGIAREIRLDYKDILINGTVVDRRTDKSIATFSYSKGNSFSYRDNSASSFSSLEKELLKVYTKIATDINIPIDRIDISGDEDNIIFTVSLYLSSSVGRAEWEDAFNLKNNKIRTLMMDLQEQIKLDYRYASFEGYIEDGYSGDTLAKFDGNRLY